MWGTGNATRVLQRAPNSGGLSWLQPRAGDTAGDTEGATGPSCPTGQASARAGRDPAGIPGAPREGPPAWSEGPQHSPQLSPGPRCTAQSEGGTTPPRPLCPQPPTPFLTTDPPSPWTPVLTDTPQTPPHRHPPSRLGQQARAGPAGPVLTSPGGLSMPWGLPARGRTGPPTPLGQGRTLGLGAGGQPPQGRTGPKTLGRDHKPLDGTTSPWGRMGPSVLGKDGTLTPGAGRDPQPWSRTGPTVHPTRVPYRSAARRQCPPRWPQPVSGQASDRR